MFSRNRTVRLLIAVFMLTVGVGLTRVGQPASPQEAYERAYLAVTEARHVGAKRYAPELLATAEAAWAAAREAWKSDAAPWHGLRSRTAGEASAQAAEATARRAIRRAHAVRDSLGVVASARLGHARTRLGEVGALVQALPVDLPIHARIQEAERLVMAAEQATTEDLWQATAQASEALAALDQAETEAEAHFAVYLAQRGQWQEWAEQAIQWSRRTGAAALVVDKLARTGRVYVGGTLQASYPVGFGRHWVGPKRYQGDRATPEGRYRVVGKKGADGTIYHRALEIDYPNAEDRRRFAAARQQGTLPARAHIGGRVELHGDGGREADWTRGCIAFRDADMEALFALVEVGAPVVIVGSVAEGHGGVTGASVGG